VQVGRSGMGGERMIIGNKEKTIVLFLHFQKIPDRPEIISQMEISGWPDAAYYSFHLPVRINEIRI